MPTMAEPHRNREQLRLGLLACAHVLMCLVSLICVAYYRYPGAFDPRTFHIFFDIDKLPLALLTVAPFALLAALFVFARFSFGYFIAFYFYTMVLSYLWLNNFSDLNYDHRLAGFSAAAGAVALMLSTLFITAPVRQVLVMSERAFDRLLLAILLTSAAIILIGATYGFRLAHIRDISELRDQVKLPTLLNYLTGMLGSTLLPFAFAGFIARKSYLKAAAALFLLLCLFPITLTKLTLFAPFWLIWIFLLTRLFNARASVMLSLLVPMSAMILLLMLFREKAAVLFAVVNFRMVAIPAVGIDVYSDFFSRQPLTHFCQISFLKPLMNCPYQDALSLVIEREYKIGNFNASLFATEGIASVGFYAAPLVVAACGFIFAIGNRLSAGLPAPFVMLSAALLPHVLLNIPLSTALLTHGTGLLFLLWYITPRNIFSEPPLFEAAPPAIDAPGRSN